MHTKPPAKIIKLKKYFRDFGTFYYYLNRFIRKTTIRNLLHLVIKNFLPRSDAPAAPNNDLGLLKKEGVIVWSRLVNQDEVNKIRQYLATKPVYDLYEFDAGRGQKPLMLEDVKITKQMKLKYFEADIAQCREIVELANSPEIIALVSGYLGCKPTICMMSAWWTKAGPGKAELFYDDRYHRDVEDYKFLKLFVYLNDVGERNGAHSFIKGSHLSNQCTQRRFLTDEEINKNFDKKNQVIFTGKSGCGFLEDTWGLHRSMPCEEGERLILHYMYSITSFNDQRQPKPLAKNIYNVDPYINRVYLY